jgi:hypothetical protein
MRKVKEEYKKMNDNEGNILISYLEFEFLSNSGLTFMRVTGTSSALPRAQLPGIRDCTLYIINFKSKKYFSTRK